MAMIEPWGGDDKFRDEFVSRERHERDETGLADIPSQGSFLDNGSRPAEDFESGAPSAGWSRNPEIQVDIEDRIFLASLPKVGTKNLRICIVAAAVSAVAGLGWMAASKLSFSGDNFTSVPDAQVAPPISNSSKSDREEIRTVTSNLTAAANSAPAKSISSLLHEEGMRSATSVKSPKAKHPVQGATKVIRSVNHAETLRTAVPETSPTTIEGWSVREVSRSTAVLEGPTGVWNATRGDSVPGLGKINSIVRWGNRWIVATSRGLVSTP